MHIPNASKLQTQTKTSRFTNPSVAALALISAGLALFASFTLATWAEASTLGHGVQHVLLFTAGIGFGGSLTSYLKRSKE